MLKNTADSSEKLFVFSAPQRLCASNSSENGTCADTYGAAVGPGMVMRQRLFNLTAIISLVLCALTLGTWICSHRVDLGLRGTVVGPKYPGWQGYVLDRDVAVFGCACGGWELCCFKDRNDPNMDWQTGIEFFSERDPVYPHVTKIFDTSGAWEFFGFGYAKIIERRSVNTLDGLVIVFPAVIPASTFGIVPILWVCRIEKARRANFRRKHGLCIHCGYDIRATPHRCSECGRMQPSVVPSLSRE